MANANRNDPGANENPYASADIPLEPRPSENSANVSPKTFGEAISRGAIVGFKWAFYIAAPLSILQLVLTIFAVAWGVLNGRASALAQWETYQLLLNPFGFLALSCVWGVLIGAIAKAIDYPFQRNRRKAF